MSPGGSGYFTCKQVTTKFKSGGLHEKHEVATWNLGNHFSICFWTQGKQEKSVSTKKNLCPKKKTCVKKNLCPLPFRKNSHSRAGNFFLLSLPFFISTYIHTSLLSGPYICICTFAFCYLFVYFSCSYVTVGEGTSVVNENICRCLNAL